MNAGFITSVLFNFLFIVLLIILLVVFVTNPTPPSRPGGQVPVCPANYPSQTLPPFQTQRPYILKTLSGKYVQSCSGCLPTPVSCADLGMIASENWNGDTIELINYGNMYQMKLNSKQTKGNYYLTMTRTESEFFNLCLTTNSNQRSTMFEIFPYISSNNNGSNLYQIGTPTTGTLLGEDEPSCLVKNGVAIQSGYNMSVNAPRGMDERSFFLLLPA